MMGDDEETQSMMDKNKSKDNAEPAPVAAGAGDDAQPGDAGEQ